MSSPNRLHGTARVPTDHVLQGISVLHVSPIVIPQNWLARASTSFAQLVDIYDMLLWSGFRLILKLMFTYLQQLTES